METINDRMEMLVNEHFGGNKAAFAKILGIERATLSNYIGGARRSKPSVDMVSKIVTTLNVDARWLLTGEEGEKAACVSVGDNSDGNIAIGSNNSVGNVSLTGNNNQLNGHGAHGNINGDVNAAILTERVKSLEATLTEKDERISEFKERIEELKERIEELKEQK